MAKAVTCIGCKNVPEEMAEYIVQARQESYHGSSTTPTQFVIEHEGTYNKFKKGKFYCTTCYIKAGMPGFARMAVKY